MTNNTRKILPVYLITIFLTLVLAGTTAIFLFMKINADREASPQTNNNASDELKFTPTAEHSQTTLFIYDSGEELNDVSFAIMRFLPEKSQIIFVPVPSNTYVQLNTVKSDIFSFYKKGGCLMAVNAVSEAYGIPIDKYMELNRDSFNSMVNIFGGVTFSVPIDISYTDEITKENTSLFSGKQFMDGTILTKMMSYPDYPAGESYRITLSVNAITDMINQAPKQRLKATLQDSFNSIINSVETNVNAFDFSFRISSMEYVLDNSDTPAKFIAVAGQDNAEGYFIPEQNSLTELKTQLDIFNNIDGNKK